MKNAKIENVRIKKRPYIFRGVFMNLLSKIDSSLVDSLHVPNKIRPYSIKLLYSENGIEFILNIFNQDLSEQILLHILEMKEQELNIGGTDFIIKNIKLETKKISNFIKNSYRIIKFEIQFKTPTYFQKKGSEMTIRFPSPLSIFTNLAHLWNQFATGDSHLDFTDFYDWVDKNIYLTSYKLKTQTIDIGKKSRPVGFIGWAKFVNLDPNNGFSNWIDALCRFGALTNLGGNRTAGCGMIEYSPIEFHV